MEAEKVSSTMDKGLVDTGESEIVGVHVRFCRISAPKKLGFYSTQRPKLCNVRRGKDCTPPV